MFFSVASLGEMVAFRVSFPPIVIFRVDFSSLIPVGALVTVILVVAVLPPSAVVTVTVAEPGLTAVTIPDWSTETTLELSDAQDTFLFSAFEGCTVAVKVNVCPASSDSSVMER